MYFRVRWLVLGLVPAACVVVACRADGVFCPEEQNRARAIALRINEEWPQRPSGDEISRYVRTLGERLGRAAPRGGGIPWRFTIIRDRAPYAFAIGYGYVYVTDGTLRFARTESELAAVIAHEIGHQLAGHFCKQREQPDGLFRGSERGEAPVGSLRQVLDLGKEQEADRYAVGILDAAGFDPRAMYTVAERLPPAAAFGHGQGDNRRLRALEETLRREGPARFVETEAEAFRNAKASVEADR